jgi:hypothetical protein
LLGVARRKHDRVTRLGKFAEGATLTTSADHADLERRAAYRGLGGCSLRQGTQRRSRQNGEQGRAGHHAKERAKVKAEPSSCACARYSAIPRKRLFSGAPAIAER